MNPNYDILGLEKDAPADLVEAGFRRLEIIFEREGTLDSEEFADIEAAYKALPLSEETIDRTVWEWVVRKDKEGEWNTLVRKAHRLKKRAEASSSWNSKEGRDAKKNKMKGRRVRADQDE